MVGKCMGNYSPSGPLFIGSITMMPRVQDLELVGPWALDVETICAVMFRWVDDLGPDKLRRPSKAQKPQWSHYGMNDKGETLPVNSNLAGSVISRESETSDARYYLGEYHRRANLLMWESIPIPLLPHPTPT